MCLAVIPNDKVRRDTNNSVSVEECIGLNTSGVCFSVVFWKSAWTHRPSFGLRTGRPTNGGCNPIRGTKSSSLKSANFLWGLLSVACKGHYGFFFQDSKRFDRAAGLIYPPSVVVLGMCGGKTEKNHEKPHPKTTICTVRSEILEVSFIFVSWSRLFFLINMNYHDIGGPR